MKVKKIAILPKGFTASAVSCGLKKSGKLDLCLFYSKFPATAEAVFTTNTFAAAPVVVSKNHLLHTRYVQAVIVNSGNANCFNGKRGLQDAKLMCRLVAEALNIPTTSVQVASTGIIGRPLDTQKIRSAIPRLVKLLSPENIVYAKQAIMTTDKFPKEITVEFVWGKRLITLSGIAKGAGMISPKMATMLAYIFTDANIKKSALKEALKEAVDFSFNRISVDGCMSTNDTVLILANGQANNPIIKSGKALSDFKEALKRVCLFLAKEIVRDGEGATKVIQIKVTNAATQNEAEKAGRAIANSNLFKTAMFGENPNIGRIVAAIGSLGLPIKEEQLKIKLKDLHKKEVKVEVSLGRGKQQAIIYTSDLSYEYIKINAAYN
ncbi:MAG: bifunctional glutamate N-acetyltransferase/amino-acid acetyltransferase ArgJ [Candidatus Omnitrophica bacterium]|nr:bifunctional glutamate N-acetyltransferase/amino-acid acetyltransferase ArgJ [Candidatus Omnitrophota bacterium]